MNDHRDHRGYEDDRADWRRGHYEPGEPPEAEQAVHRTRQDHAAQQPKHRRTKTAGQG